MGRRVRLTVVVVLVTVLWRPAAAEILNVDPLEDAVQAFLADDLEGARLQFEEIVAADPDRAEAQAWLAETLRRLDSPHRARIAADAALRLKPCLAQAHKVLGDLSYFQPEDGTDRSRDYARALVHYRKAVGCDPDDGGAWVMVWVVAMHDDDADLERRAIEALHRLGYYTPAARAHARWLLAGLPANALLVTNGDMDTFPLLMLQEIEGLRRDVLVVNRSLLNAPSYARRLAARHGIPLPDGPWAPRPGPDGRPVSPSQAIIAGWLDEARSLGRPMAFAVTIPVLDVMTISPVRLQLAGGHHLYARAALAVPVDVEAVVRGLRDIDMEVMTGPMVSKRDLSPGRRQRAPEAALDPPRAALKAAAAAFENDDPEQAAELLDWAEDFLTRLPPDLSEDLRSEVYWVRSRLARWKSAP